MKFTNKQIGIVLAILAVLAVGYWWGGHAPGLRGWQASPSTLPVSTPLSPGAETPGGLQQREQSAVLSPGQTTENEEPEVSSLQPEENVEVKTPEAAKAGSRPGSDKERPLTADEKLALAAAQAAGKSSAGVEKGSAGYSQKAGMDIDQATGQDRYRTDPVPAGKPVPAEPQDAAISDVARTCTLSVRCDSILDNIAWLDQEKVELVPADGVIFPATAVTFYEGESVFNVLHRVMKQNKIHLEFKNTPVYNSAYIEGINNLYEFDCGELSGWVCKVNDWFPNYGSSRYQLQDGDVVELLYTCDLGVDAGGYYSVSYE